MNKKQESGRNLIMQSTGIFIGAVLVNSLGFVTAAVIGTVLFVTGYFMSKSK